MAKWLDDHPYEWVKSTDIKADLVTVGLSRVDEQHTPDQVVLMVSFTDEFNRPRRALAMYDAAGAQDVAQSIALCAHEIQMEQQ